MKILVLGVTGMLGNALFRLLAQSKGIDVAGVARSADARNLFAAALRDRVHGGFDAHNPESIAELFAAHQPDVVINCVGIVKQLSAAAQVLEAVPINSLLPHRIARLCKVGKARLVHISTDCVFTGRSGMYREADAPDATDLYGLSKLWGEVDGPNAITLRTSIIGPELRSGHGLLNWFLSQEGSVKGYQRAIFSGLPTVELSRVIRDFVLPRPDMHGLYHVAASPISKLELLKLFAAEYGRQVKIVPDAALAIDRSLDGSRFREATGYVAPPWPLLVAEMREFG
ncbi:MAG: dTDP-4-dehydrorhamnose reductase family protein [Bacillota bacterium]